ncbi:MAG: putative ABC transporter permease [Oscillospiraceae bacterium]|jgi:hypothetical protein|nr:putative ABC transporter permease [Oscillospiraceae bacterium]
MPRVLKYPALFSLGGSLYPALELLFRGYTHWTMAVAGGVCLPLLYAIAVKSRVPLPMKWFAGGAAITAVEFVTGFTVNILLGWNVWSYADAAYNVMGQICLPFSLLWVLLSAPAMWMCEVMERKVFRAVEGTYENVGGA